MLALTWIEVVDTAVIIGLSGVIAAGVGYLLAKRFKKRKIHQEYFRNRQEVIERVATEFSAIHLFFFDICMGYSSASDYLQAALRVSYGQHFEHVIDNLRRIHLLEDKLLIVGADGAARALRHYRLHATEISDMLRPYPPIKTRHEVSRAVAKLGRRRDSFFQELPKSFRTI